MLILVLSVFNLLFEGGKEIFGITFKEKNAVLGSTLKVGR